MNINGTEHNVDLDRDDDGWIFAACACGWASPPCPDFSTAADIYAEDHLVPLAADIAIPDAPFHIADIGDTGWALQHPRICRPNMLRCAVHEAASNIWQSIPAPPGFYRAELNDDGTIDLTPLEESEDA